MKMKKIFIIITLLALFSNSALAGGLYYYAAARAKINEGKVAESAKYLVEAITIDKDSLFLRYELLLVLFKLRLNKDAMTIADSILKAEPDNINTLIIKGNIEYSEKQFYDAEKTFKKIIELDPLQYDFYLPLSKIYTNNNEIKKSISILKQGLSYFSDDTNLRYNLGMLYDKIGKRWKGIKEVRKILKKEPENAEALNFIGYTLCDMGRKLKTAEKLIKKALKLQPESGYITDSLGWLYYKKKEYEKALEFLKKAAEITKNDPIIFEHLGDVYIKLKNKEKALKNYKKAEEMSENDEKYRKKIIKKIKKLE
jgi:tetratricopeptide (TPR) repeat protein